MILFKQQVGWCDASWAPSYGDHTDNLRSQTGWCFTLLGSLVSHVSRRQSVVAQSSCEAEWVAAADASKEAVFLAKLFKEFSIPKYGPSVIMCDSKSAIQQTVNAVDQHRCRHINLRQHFIRRQCHLGEIELECVPT